MLSAVDFYVYPPKEIAIVGPLAHADTQALLDTTRKAFIPNKIVAHLDPTSDDTASLSELLQLLEFKVMVQDKATAYVCKNFTCKQPVSDVDGLREQLELTKGK